MVSEDRNSCKRGFLRTSAIKQGLPSDDPDCSRSARTDIKLLLCGLREEIIVHLLSFNSTPVEFTIIAFIELIIEKPARISQSNMSNKNAGVPRGADAAHTLRYVFYSSRKTRNLCTAAKIYISFPPRTAHDRLMHLTFCPFLRSASRALRVRAVVNATDLLSYSFKTRRELVRIEARRFHRYNVAYRETILSIANSQCLTHCDIFYIYFSSRFRRGGIKLRL